MLELGTEPDTVVGEDAARSLAATNAGKPAEPTEVDQIWFPTDLEAFTSRRVPSVASVLAYRVHLRTRSRVSSISRKLHRRLRLHRRRRRRIASSPSRTTQDLSWLWQVDNTSSTNRTVYISYFLPNRWDCVQFNGSPYRFLLDRL